MPIISCPKCQGKLRFPEDSPPRRVKCPTCGHVFVTAGTVGPTDAAPTSAEPRRPAGDRDKDRQQRDEDDDRDRRRGRDDDRRTRRRLDDDDRDRPRRRNEDDDRDRRHRRDEDDDRRPQSNRRAVERQFNRASMACLLVFIAGWLQVGGLGLLVFARLLMWAELRDGVNVFVVVGGLLGLGSLLTAATGFGFLLSGPRDRGALGLSIGTAAVAAFHLILVVVIATVQTQMVVGNQYVGVDWPAFVTEVPALPRVLFFLIGVSSGNLNLGRAIIPIFASLAEVAKVVLFLMTLRAIMGCARDSRRARLCMQALVANAVGVGVLMVAGILFGLLVLAVRNEKGGWMAVASVFDLVLSLTVAAVVVWTTLVTKSVKEGIDYRRD